MKLDELLESSYIQIFCDSFSTSLKPTSIAMGMGQLDTLGLLCCQKNNVPFGA